MKISSYGFGEVVVDGKRYTEDIIIFPQRVAEWWRKQGHVVEIADLKEAILVKPQVVILGTGAYGAVRIRPEVEKYLNSENVRLIALPTREACARYNELHKQNLVVAALHLTC
ncbi:MAG: Mth938-like domain-containing protein [Bacillota bacterium]